MGKIEFDEVHQLRKLGIGLVLGGLVLAILSFTVGSLTAGSTLVISGILVWMFEYRRELTVGIGLGVGVVGVIVFVETTIGTDQSLLELAGFAIVAGAADYLLAPLYGKIRDRGKQVDAD